jgi:hypothetical protein
MPTAERRIQEAAKRQAVLGTEVDLIPLYVRADVVEALVRVQQALRADAKLYRQVELMLARMQAMTTHGPLTDCLKVLVGTDEE